jgi:high-affinity iron transporter
VYAGVGAGVLASLATWVAAVTLVPVSGASRELVEGVTALVAVGVLLYVSHWLFQKTYIHDWKAYLEQHLGRAVTRGSAFAMAGLAFAAVYREGFETVLFYQALMFDAGAGAVLAGFAPGILIIAAIGYGIVRLGLRLPLKRVFGITGSVLLYLAFVFIGKGLYNLQEAGLFSPHPLPWMPDHEALRQLLGLYPLAETLLAQAGFLTLLAAAAVWHRARSRAAAATHAAPPPAMDSAPEFSASTDRTPTSRTTSHSPHPEPQEVG